MTFQCFPDIPLDLLPLIAICELNWIYWPCIFYDVVSLGCREKLSKRLTVDAMPITSGICSGGIPFGYLLDLVVACTCVVHEACLSVGVASIGKLSILSRKSSSRRRSSAVEAAAYHSVYPTIGIPNGTIVGARSSAKFGYRIWRTNRLSTEFLPVTR